MGTPVNFRAHDANNDVTVFASAARTATTNSTDMENRGARGVRLFLAVTAASGTTPTLDVKVQVKDPINDTYIDVPGGAFTQKTTTVTDELTIYPGVTVSANRAVSWPLSQKWRVVATIGGTTPSFTFSLAACYIV